MPPFRHALVAAPVHRNGLPGTQCCEHGLLQVPAYLLGKIEVLKDMDCLFHALAYPDGSLGKDLRYQVAAFMQQQAPKQGAFQATWLHDADRLLNGVQGGYTAIIAFSLMKHLKIEVRADGPSGGITIIDATHPDLKIDPNLPVRRVFYNGKNHHYEALVELGRGIVFPTSEPMLCTTCSCSCHAPPGFYGSKCS